MATELNEKVRGSKRLEEHWEKITFTSKHQTKYSLGKWLQTVIT